MSESSSSWGVAEASANWRLAPGDLPDVNVWVGLCSAEHPFHAAAMRYWQSACEAGMPLWFCRTTMMGLVRVLSQPRAMGPNALNLTQAMTLYRQWLDTPAVGLLADPAGLDDAIEQLLGGGGSHNLFACGPIWDWRPPPKVQACAWSPSIVTLSALG